MTVEQGAAMRVPDIARASASEGACFEQAKNPARRSQFLQIVAKPKQAARGGRPEPKLTRVAFKVSRLMEFCSERELQNQTGHAISDWGFDTLSSFTCQPP
jgi:hypothetical protein